MVSLATIGVCVFCAAAYGNPFLDIRGNKNFDYIVQAYNWGITAGISEDSFAPNVDINREQLATMLHRAIKKYKYPEWILETDDEYYTNIGNPKKFADDADISDFARTSVYFLSQFGIIKGVDDTHFAPKNTTTWQEAQDYATATREQAILMSLRIFKIDDMGVF